MIRKLFVMFMTVVMVFISCFVTTPVYASLRYTDSIYAKAILRICDDVGYCDVQIYGDSNTTSITNVNATLVDNTNNIIAEWKDLSSKSSKLLLEKVVKDLEKGKTYTFYVSGTVNGNGSHETVSDSVTVSY